MQDNSLYVMDALELLKGLPDDSVDLIYADPPYNVSNAASVFRDYRVTDRVATISYDFGEWDYAYDPVPFLVEAKRVLNKHGNLIVWTSENLFAEYFVWMKNNMRYRNLLFYIRTNPLPNFRKRGYRQCTELMAWATMGSLSDDNPNWIFPGQEESKTTKYAPICGGKERRKLANGKSHPTQKPLKICREIIRTHCRPDGLVVDPYCGVGTIPLAAHLEGRRFIGGDLNAEYVDVAKTRIVEGY